MLPYLQASDDRLLPLITYNQILLGVTVMVCLKITVKQIFKNVILESVRNKRFQKELDTQYYYHLGMVLVLVATASWNAYDFYLWLASYVAVGILRNALNDLVQSQNALLQTHGFDNQIKQMLIFSRQAGLLFLSLSVGYICSSLWFFCHSNVPLLLVQLYPTLRLTADSFLIFVRSTLIYRQLPYFYNNNIDKQPSISEYRFIHRILSALIKTAHYAKLLSMLPKPSLSFFILVHGPWIALLVAEFFKALREFATQMTEYYQFRWLIRRTDTNLRKDIVPKADLCSICLDELVSSRKLSCGHHFHYRCILRWIESRTQAECPICRAGVLRMENRYRCSQAKQHY